MWELFRESSETPLRSGGCIVAGLGINGTPCFLAVLFLAEVNQ